MTELLQTSSIAPMGVEQPNTATANEKFTQFSPLVVTWDTILFEFSQRYDEVFEISSSKIHLDISSQVIDGVKGKWKFVTLLDCLLCIILGMDKSRRESGRRRFNQYVALRESVCFACGESWVKRIDTQNIAYLHQETEFPSAILLDQISFPWDSCDSLRRDFMLEAPKKSYNKRLQIIDGYFSINIFKEKSLFEIISSAVSIIYCQHYHSADRSPAMIAQIDWVRSLDKRDKQVLSDEDSTDLEGLCADFFDFAC